MSFQGHKGRIFILSECQCPVREISVFVPLPKISGNMRFSCREAETYCQRYADLTCHEVCRKIGLTVCGRLKCKYMSMFSRQSDILFLLGKTFQIEKKRPGRVRSFPVFRPFFSRCTEVAGMMCGEKKCFFSQAIFRSAEIETRLELKTVEKQAEMPKYEFKTC
mgnify:CR=1 FL=1